MKERFILYFLEEEEVEDEVLWNIPIIKGSEIILYQGLTRIKEFSSFPRKNKIIVTLKIPLI